jgi:hypothetical protein
MVRKIGFAIFILSCLLWALILVIPWLGYTKTQVAGIITALIIAGEITFYLSVFMLGKSFLEKIKSKFKLRKSEPETSQNQDL